MLSPWSVTVNVVDSALTKVTGTVATPFVKVTGLVGYVGEKAPIVDGPDQSRVLVPVYVESVLPLFLAVIVTLNGVPAVGVVLAGVTVNEWLAAGTTVTVPLSALSVPVQALFFGVTEYL